MFGLDDLSALNHQNERRIWGLNEDGELALLPQTSTDLEEELEVVDDKEEEPNKDEQKEED